MKEMEAQLCKNCKNEFQGNYCFHCGQSLTFNKRLKLGSVVSDFFDNTFNLHKGFFYTFWMLIVFPGTILGEYIEGIRKKYTNPTRYLVIALAGLAASQYWADANEAISKADFGGFTFLSEQLNNSMASWDFKLITEWTLLGNLLEALLLPFGFYWLFRKSKYNYAELLTVSFYLVANSIFITILFVGLPKFLIDIYAPVLIVGSGILVYYIYALLSFFKKTPFFKRVILVLIGLIIFFILRFFLIPFLFALVFPLAIK